MFFSSLFWEGSGAHIFSQIYPVHISTQLIPPYSGYLPDYADPSAEKLKVILQFNDFSVPQYNLKLKFEIKGNGFTLSTKTFYIPPPITLIPGQPFLLSGADLAPYLNSNNLDFIGINQSQYERRMALPEGYYDICVTAYDYSNTNIQVSNQSCTQAWFTLSDPPFLNLPVCTSTLIPLNPQNIIFQWTPMNLGSPNSALNTEYEFALWECRPDNNVNENQIVLSTAPIYSITTQQTFINYGINEPPLNLYMKYVWRVKAKDNTGRDLFKNSGNSQICTFTYGNLTNVLGDAINLTLNAQTINHRTGQCNWTKQSVYENYLLQVRKLGTEYWFDYPNVLGIERVGNLEPNTTYQARVRGEGNGITGNWSNIAVFTTQGPPNYSCNDQANPYNTTLPNPLPINKASAGLIIQSGQFEIITTKIETTGSPGWFKGEGFALIFGAKRVAVKWKNIYIDEANQHQQGKIEAVTDGINKWLSQWDINVAEDNATYENGIIDSVFVNGNQICYTLQGSNNNICIPTPSNVNAKAIRDGEGNEYIIVLTPPPPKINGPIDYINYSSDSLDVNDSTKIIFEASINQNYGFDKKEYAAFIPNYETIKLKTGKNYFVANKSVGEGQNDIVVANVQITNFNPSLLSFKLNNGTVLNTVTTNNINQVVVIDIPSNAGCVYAWYNNKKIGKLNVFSLKPIIKKVVFVPINNATPNITQNQLNDLFKQANVSYSVSIAPSFSFNLGVDGLEAADANLLSKYSSEMRKLRDAYKNYDTLYDKQALYIFVVSEFSNPDLKGYMARGRAVGFISSGTSPKEIAHEIAHGAFSLEHTFPKIEKQSSSNLMDYTNGVQLVLEQWKQMQMPNNSFNWFDDEEDASYYNLLMRNNTALSVYYWINKLKVAYKNNQKVRIPETTTLIGKAPKCMLGGIEFPFVNVYTKYVGPGQDADVKDRVTIGSASIETDGVSLLQPCVLVDDGKFILHAPPGFLSALKIYIESNTFKNLILFVNGYRPIVNRDGDPIVGSPLEYDDSNNQVEAGDSRGYWKGIDAQFMNRIGTRQAVYADGHHSVATSNHGSVGKFSWAFGVSAYAKLKCPTLDGICLDKSYLHTTPNFGGFMVRQKNGELAAEDLISKINQGIHIFNKETDTLDIVAHSMGYAYSIGMIKKLKAAGIKFGRFYIIAPENAVGGSDDWNKFTEVWQYGSNLGEKGEDAYYLQDGIAPQCPVPNITGKYLKTKTGRIFIPSSVETKSFLGSHSISNYGWIFTERTQGKDGYIKPR
jgi:hypothetical protein